MYSYHDSPHRPGREKMGWCRCKSEHRDAVLAIDELLSEKRVCDPSNRKVYLTSVPAPPDRPSAEGQPYRFIYAIDIDYNVRIALDTERPEDGSIKHETLFKNSDVRAAGEVGFVKGVVTTINDHSGSYGTDARMADDKEFVDAILRAFAEDKVEMCPFLREKLEDLL